MSISGEKGKAMHIEGFLDNVKKERNAFFKNSFERAYQAFVELEYDKEDEAFFLENASLVVEKMRSKCWEDFLIEEKEFTSRMLRELIDESYVSSLSPIEAIEWYVDTYPEHIYQLNLSNTQSRRSRAGKEFEDIIELILLGANVPMDSQGNIGKESFVQKGLGKLVDVVSPGAIEFEENKRNVVLISAKTTLRERWQEVPEEMGRVGAREMFLATLDDKVSDEVLNTLYEANIQLTTTKEIKNRAYPNNSRVLTFEDLVKICKENAMMWKAYNYDSLKLEQAMVLVDKQIKKHEGHEFVKNSLVSRLLAYSKLYDEIK